MRYYGSLAKSIVNVQHQHGILHADISILFLAYAMCDIRIIQLQLYN
jgi:hypothetical protein